MMKSALTILVLILCAALLQGMPTSSRGRCVCRGRRMRPDVDMRNIAEVEYHLPSSSCERDELVVIFKTDGSRGCLDLNGPQGRRIKEAIMKKKK